MRKSVEYIYGVLTSKLGQNLIGFNTYLSRVAFGLNATRWLEKERIGMPLLDNAHKCDV